MSQFHGPQHRGAKRERREAGRPGSPAPNIAAELIDSIEGHYLAGCRSLSSLQFTEHRRSGVCDACRARGGNS